MQAPIKDKDLLILSCLRRNARETLTSMSKITGIPVSTVFDMVRLYEKGIIRKYLCLVDFGRLGFSTRATILLKVVKEDRDALREYLARSSHVNSTYRINRGYDFLVEAVFRDMKEAETFLQALDGFQIDEKLVHYVIEDLKREQFMAYEV